MKIFTLSLSTFFYDMSFFVYNNLRQLLLPAERRKLYMSSWSWPAVINGMILSKLYAGIRQSFFNIRILFLKMFQLYRYCSEKSCLSTQIFLKLIPHILYDKMKWFMIKILKLIDDDLCLMSDVNSCQVERKQKYLIELFSEEVIGNFYN